MRVRIVGSGMVNSVALWCGEGWRPTVETCGWRLHAFVLMSNHNRLFVETPEANLAAGMQFLNGGYSDYRDVRKAWPWMTEHQVR